MPPPYQQPHWNVFAGIPYQAQGPIGVPPSQWVVRHRLADVPNQAMLPNYQLDRTAVRSICQNPKKSVLFGYVYVMAWGGQGSRQGGHRHIINAWNTRQQFKRHLRTLRKGKLSRIDAYNLLKHAAIPGLGPSFFTKLLYFFNPTPSFYIMDQWTAKSVNFLTGNRVVRMGGKAPSDNNTGGNYQAFCEEVDLIAGLLGCSGQVAEERLYSQGGHRWPWRAYVHANWADYRPAERYNAGNMHAIYPHIPFADFRDD